ncbi:MAG TPA: TVP38/TMEM64 family protein [Bacillota bacterium]|nr:TVP38/TMEM64 family protein [Bacillota bacterium]
MTALLATIDWKKIFDEEQLYQFVVDALDNYERLGPFIGISLPFIEAILPFLPLIIFVFVNIAAFGLVKGFVYSWVGATVGSIIVFLIFRRLGKRRLFKKVRDHEQVSKVTQWVDRQGFGLIFLLLCFPFSPSFVINVVAGLSKISPQQFALAVIFGKAVMIFSVAYVGENIFSFAKHPLRTIVIGLSIVLFWIIGKQIEHYIQKRTEQTKGDK